MLSTTKYCTKSIGNYQFVHFNLISLTQRKFHETNSNENIIRRLKAASYNTLGIILAVVVRSNDYHQKYLRALNEIPAFLETVRFTKYQSTADALHFA